MYGRLRRVPRGFLIGLGLLLGLALVAVLGTPRVIEFSPPNGNRQVPSTAPIVIKFSQAMDTATVASRLSIDPRPPGQITWRENTLIFEPLEPWPEALTIEVRLSAGSRTRRFMPMLRGVSWSFTIGAPRILYLWPSDGTPDLYARFVESGETERLTDTSMGVLDYSLSRDGTAVVYVAEREDGGSDLRLYNLATGEDGLLYGCPTGSRCQSPSLSPGKDLLAFERSDLEIGAAGKKVPGPSRIWLTTVDGSEEGQPVGTQDHVTSIPRWSPNGELAYYDNTIRAIVLAEIDGELNAVPMVYIPTSLGNMSSWSPDGDSLVFTEMIFVEEPEATSESPTETAGEHDIESAQFYSHLFQFQVATGEISDLSYATLELVEDASPAYSPDGRWIAFARKYLRQEDWTPGRQLWIMRADGSLITQLTNDPDYNHSSLAWSPDSSELAYMRFNQTDFTQPPTIWIIEIDSMRTSQLVEGGYLPRWIPW